MDHRHDNGVAYDKKSDQDQDYAANSSPHGNAMTIGNRPVLLPTTDHLSLRMLKIVVHNCRAQAVR
jgi:hypothetical protein